jgi:alkylation response protein AidB-like acyl-CoA dehydrogenase
MAIDFSFPEEVTFIVARVRQFCDEVVAPAQEEIEANEGDRKVLVRQIVAMRKAAKEWGLWLPHMPEEWGGMGLGHVELAGAGRGREEAYYGPFALNCPGARRGQHAHAAALGDRRAEGEVPAAAVRGHGDELLRDDRARGRRFGSDAHPHHAR